jgi:hypothetical protein
MKNEEQKTKTGKIVFRNRKTGQKFTFLFIGKVKIEGQSVAFKGRFKPMNPDPSVN